MFSPPVASPKKAAHEPYAAVRRTRETAVSRALRPMPTIGNQATVRMLQTRVYPAIQTKLVVDRPGDPLEQEADRVAEHATRMAQPSVQRQCACGGTCGACRKEHHGDLQK